MPEATQSIGQVVQVSGKVTVQGQEGIRTLEEGDAIYKGDMLVTSDDSNIQIEFTDDTRVSLGANSQAEIDDYVFDQDQPGAGKFLMDMGKGAMRCVSGEIAEQNPDEFNVETPLASIGIRGTVFGVRLGETGEADFWVEDIGPGHRVIFQDQAGRTRIIAEPNQGFSMIEGENITQAPSLDLEQIETLSRQLPFGVNGTPETDTEDGEEENASAEQDAESEEEQSEGEEAEGEDSEEEGSEDQGQEGQSEGDNQENQDEQTTATQERPAQPVRPQLAPDLLDEPEGEEETENTLDTTPANRGNLLGEYAFLAESPEVENEEELDDDSDEEFAEYKEDTITQIFGDSSANKLIGTSGRDEIFGYEENDTLQGKGGDDFLDGGSNYEVDGPGDEAWYTDAPSGITVSPSGSDLLVNDGHGGTDTLKNIEFIYGSDYADTMTGNGTELTFEGAAGDDRIDGATSEDHAEEIGAGVSYARAQALNGSQGVNIDFSGPDTGADSYTDSITVKHQYNGETFEDTVKGVSTLVGSDHDDTIIGHDKIGDSIIGLDGADYLDGGVLDTNDPEAWNEVFFTADDETAGVSVSYDLTSGSGSATDSSGSTDTLENFTHFEGTEFDDTLTFSGSDPDFTYRIEDSPGGDTYEHTTSNNDLWVAYDHGPNGIKMNNSSEVIDPWGDTDYLSNIYGINGTDYNDTIIGDNDTVTSNTLHGFDGNDILIGNKGVDNLYGGSGDDIFTYTSINDSNLSDGIDTIYDFEINGDDTVQFDIGTTNTGLFSSAITNGNLYLITGTTNTTTAKTQAGSTAGFALAKLFGTFASITEFTSALTPITSGLTNASNFIAFALNSGGSQLWVAKASTTGDAVDSASGVMTIDINPTTVAADDIEFV